MSTELDFAEAWRPSPGTIVEGKIVDLDTRHGEYEPYPIVTLENGEGRVAIHAFHEVLQSELARRSPKLGDTIRITYRGKHPDRGYHVYSVSSDGDLDFSWAQFGGTRPGDGGAGDPGNTGAREDDVPF